jgi:hypothetical protein
LEPAAVPCERGRRRKRRTTSCEAPPGHKVGPVELFSGPSGPQGRRLHCIGGGSEQGGLHDEEVPGVWPPNDIIKENRRDRLLLSARGLMGNRLLSFTAGRIWLLRPALAAARPASAGEGGRAGGSVVGRASGSLPAPGTKMKGVRQGQRPSNRKKKEDCARLLEGLVRENEVKTRESLRGMRMHACRLPRYDLACNQSTLHCSMLLTTN